MAKIDIKTIAASAEIVASIAVVVSLILVVVSIDQNTSALRAINDNFLYDLQNHRLSEVVNDAELAVIISNFEAGKETTQAEELRYRFWQVQELNMWEIAFTRYQEGLLPAKQWESWDGYWSLDFPKYFPEEWWSGVKYQYNKEFAAHVDAIYAEKQ